MKETKKRGRPVSDNPQSETRRVRLTKDDSEEAGAIAKSEGYTFSGWVKMLIKKEIKRIKRRKK